MSANITKNNGNSTVKFQYTAPSAKINSVLEDACHYLYKEVADEDGVLTNPWADATDAEKLALLDKHIKTVILNLAKTYKINADQKVARERAEADASTNYDLGE